MNLEPTQPPTVPSSLPYAPPMVNRDLEHLKVLSICWYVIAGLNALGGCFMTIYVAMGAMFMAAPPNMTTQPGQPPPPSPETVGGIIMGFGGCLMLLALGTAALAFFAARGLGRQRGRMFCMIVAGITCLSVPIGTVLGVFTLIVLSRPSVAQLFARNAAAPEPV